MTDRKGASFGAGSDAGSGTCSARIRPATDAPAEARRLLTGWLDGHDRTADAVLAVSEVVTNAVRYGHGSEPLTLRLAVMDAGFRVEVDQPTVRTVEAPDGFPGPEQGRGRGLAVVEALADRWGVTYGSPSDSSGMTVWFEMR